jgi:hypothetical protein
MKLCKAPSISWSSDSDSVNLGSNPSPPANLKQRLTGNRRAFLLSVGQLWGTRSPHTTTNRAYAVRSRPGIFFETCRLCWRKGASLMVAKAPLRPVNWRWDIQRKRALNRHPRPTAGTDPFRSFMPANAVGLLSGWTGHSGMRRMGADGNKDLHRPDLKSRHSATIQPAHWEKRLPAR